MTTLLGLPDDVSARTLKVVLISRSALALTRIRSPAVFASVTPSE